MVIKTCKICGKEFDAKGSDKCCSSECSKENKRKNKKEWRKANPEKQREYDRKWREANPEKSRESNRKSTKKWREANPEYDAQYREKNRDKLSERRKEYYKANHEEETKRNMLYNQNIISELCEQYGGNLEEILANVPNKSWVVREAKMQVWFGESYADGMIAKMESTPVCEVTGESNDLVIHHFYSFNTHPELGADPNNMVRVNTNIHKKFHSIYGYGNNTRKQWNEFVENLDIKSGD